VAFTLPTYVTDPTLLPPGELAEYVTDPTLSPTVARIPTYVTDPTLTPATAKFGAFVTDPTLTPAGKLAAYITAPTAAQSGAFGQLQYFTMAMTGVVGETATVANTMQNFVVSMTGVQQLPNRMQNFVVAMTGQSGVVASLNLQPQQFVSVMRSDAFGSVLVTPQGFTISMSGVAGAIGSMTGATQYLTSGMTGYVQVTGSMAVTIRSFFVSMAADTGVGTNYATVSMHTEWQAITQYTNYPFNSFAQFNNLFMGASSTGLYVLSGANDNGVNIDAIARTGITDMGTSHLKKNEYVYVGYRATGDLKLRINTNDSHVRDYMIRYNGETGLHVKRVKLGKGVIARYWQLEIQNLDGADFDLNTLEIKPTVLSRRVASGRA